MKKLDLQYKHIAEICRNLSNTGKKPTARNIREILGYGSLSTILEHLHQWQKESALSVTVDEDLSPDIKQAILAECGRKLSAIREMLQSKIDERDTQLNETKEILKETELRVEEITADLERHKKESYDRYLYFERKVAAADEQAIIRTEYANEVTKKTDQQIAELRENLKKLQEEKHQSDIRAAAAEARNTELEKQISAK